MMTVFETFNWLPEKYDEITYLALWFPPRDISTPTLHIPSLFSSHISRRTASFFSYIILQIFVFSRWEIYLLKLSMPEGIIHTYEYIECRIHKIQYDGAGSPFFTYIVHSLAPASSKWRRVDFCAVRSTLCMQREYFHSFVVIIGALTECVGIMKVNVRVRVAVYAKAWIKNNFGQE